MPHAFFQRRQRMRLDSELRELERTNPEVRKAREEYEATVSKIIGVGRLADIIPSDKDTDR